jgi:hypothetical protein
MSRDRRALLWALLIFALCDLVLVLPGWWEYGVDAVLGSPKHDMLLQFAIWRDYTREALLSGRLPEWNPHLFAGTPFLAAQQAAPFYPPNWPLLALPTPLALNLGRVLHLLIAQIGTYVLVRKLKGVHLGALLAGLVYSFGSHMSYHFFNGGIGALDGLAWSPWLLVSALIALRGRLGLGVALATIFSSLQILAGYTQLIQLTWFGLLPWIVPMAWVEGLSLRTSLRRIGAFVASVPVLTSLTSAAALVPAFEFVSRSSRRGFDPEWVGMLSLPPRNLWGLVAPDLFGAPWSTPVYWSEGYAWETILFLGVGPLLAIAWTARRRKALPWLIPIGVLLLIALGRHNPLFLFAAEHVPGMGLFRGPAKHIIPLGLYASVLAGLGLPLILRAHTNTVLALLAGVAALALPLLAQSSAPAGWEPWVTSVATQGEHFRPVEITNTFGADTWAQARAALLVALLWAGLSLTVLALRGTLGRGRAARALVALALVELLLFACSRAQFFPMSHYELAPGVRKLLDPGDGQPARVALLSGEEVNRPMAVGLETLSGYEAVLSQRTNTFYNRWEGWPVDEQRYLRWVATCDATTRLLNQRFIVLKAGVRPPVADTLTPPLRQVARASGHDVWLDPGALPRAFLVTRSRVIADPDALATKLAERGFDPRSEVLLAAPPEDLTLAAKPPPNRDSARVVLHDPEEVHVAVETQAATFLVLGDSYDVGWHAFVGDVELPIMPAYGFVRCVRLPPGVWDVQFRYSSPVWLGAGLSMLGLLLVLGIGVRSRREPEPA